MKKMILVTSPPASGKTFISKALAEQLKHVVYLDKDALIVLSKQIFAVAHQPYDRSSRFFQRYIRNYEYEAIITLGLQALQYDNIVLINAPFTREIRDPEYMNALAAKLAGENAQLYILWVITQPKVVHQRMVERNSDRDRWKITHWDEYIQTVDFTVPSQLDNPAANQHLLLFHNSTQQEFEASMRSVLTVLEG